jgi:hypothetical protein
MHRKLDLAMAEKCIPTSGVAGDLPVRSEESISGLKSRGGEGALRIVEWP